MTLSTRQFRGMVWLYVALSVAGVFFDRLFPGLMPEVLRTANEKFIQDMSASLSPWVLWLYAVLIVTCLVSLVGLYRFKPWARPLNLLLVGAGVVLSFFPPYGFGFSSVALALTTASTMLNGAILAAAYFAPEISKRFALSVDPGRLAQRLSAPGA